MTFDRRVILHQIVDERKRQDEKWGADRNLPDGTNKAIFRRNRELSKELCDTAVKTGALDWRDILAEEFWEACAEEDPVLLRAELIQVAAVAVAWAEAIDRRT